MRELRSTVEKRRLASHVCLAKHELAVQDDNTCKEGRQCDACGEKGSTAVQECARCDLVYCKSCAGKSEHGDAPVRRSRRQSMPANRVRFSSQMKNLFGEDKKCDPSMRANMKRVHRNPSIYVIDNFLTESELEHLDQLQPSNCKNGGSKRVSSFSRSYTEDMEGGRVVSSHRTSQFVYLKKFGDPKVRAIERRASDLVGLPTENVEPLQVVRYKDGQYFGLHHDCGELLDDGTVVGSENGAGSRLVTFFVYLNTVDPKGGGTTYFPRLRNGRGLHVRPKRGTAVLWSNLLESGEVDPRVIHEALPTKNGQRKFGMNIWISPFSMLDYSLSKSGLVLSSAKRTRCPESDTKSGPVVKRLKGA